MLIAAAERNIADAQFQALSSENRFDAAYKAIMQMAMVALNAKGYRTLKSKPGHHQTAIQTLPLTVGLPQPRSGRTGRTSRPDPEPSCDAPDILESRRGRPPRFQRAAVVRARSGSPHPTALSGFRGHGSWAVLQCLSMKLKASRPCPAPRWTGWTTCRRCHAPARCVRRPPGARRLGRATGARLR